MYYKIMELLIQEDTFRLFTTTSSSRNLSFITSKIPTFNTLSEFKACLVKFFRDIIVSSQDENLEYYESFKMLNFIEKVFHEITENEDSCFDMTDEIIKAYTESLVEFTKNMDIDIIKKHVKFLLS